MKPKDLVFVKSLKREGVVIEALPNGSFRVAVGSMQIECQANELKALDKKTWDKYAKTVSKSLFRSPGREEQKKASSPLDLHGLTVAEAIPLVAKKIDEAILNDLDRVEIIHGVGTGKLLTAVHAFLKAQSVVKAFKLDEHNSGTTFVYF